MCSPIAAGGLAATGVGTGINAYGQSQALDAMRDVWSGQDRAQAGYNAQLAARTEEMLKGINLDQVLGSDVGQKRTAALDTSAKNAVSAVQTQAGKRTKGSRGGAESRARVAESNKATLARSLQGNRLAGILAGLSRGGQDMDMLGRSFALDARNIRNDSQRWANLAPMQEQAAGMKGGPARQIGSLFNTLGQGAMFYGMAQPSSTPGMTAEDLYLNQQTPAGATDIPWKPIG